MTVIFDFFVVVSIVFLAILHSINIYIRNELERRVAALEEERQ